MRVVPDGRFEINDPCLGPRAVIRYAGAADSRGHRDVQGDALRGQGMHDRFRLERRAAALASVQNRMKSDTFFLIFFLYKSPLTRLQKPL